ncbi:PspC domain-containing protein [Corynebacterium sp. L4756]|uniref:PspC domain-containing protein n=1 Tax=unclassified Corynebacterium TaxID=2624378 RepID=UPI00374D3E11
MTSYEPSPYGPGSRPSGKNEPGAHSGATPPSNPYQKPSSLSDNTNNADAGNQKPPRSFMDEVSDAWKETKESVSQAFDEMRTETTPKHAKPSDASATTGTGATGAGSQAGASDKPHSEDSGFEDIKAQFKEMWASRPVRLPSDQGGGGKIAGVAEGIAVRYQVDPILVRTIFVVTAFCWGGSIALYLLAWMIMPRYSKTTSPIEDAFGSPKDLPVDSEGKSTSEKSLGTTLAVIFAIGFIIPLIFSSSSVTMLLPILAGVGGWYLLHKRRPVAPTGLLATPQTPRGDNKQDAQNDDHIDLSMFEPVDGYPFPEGRTTPPSWDPLGAAPDTWHLPDPDPVMEEPKKEKKGRRWGRIIVITTAVIAFWAAIITAATIFAASHFNEDSTWGTVNEAPVSAADVSSTYDVGVGTFDLDLSETTGIDDLAEPRTVTIDGGIGEMTIKLPEDTPVNVRCDDGIGDSNCQNITVEDAMMTIDIDSGIGSTIIDYGFMESQLQS